MVRRSAGFVSKRAHKKSRGGCLTCKKKKVKCDEAVPSCTYCATRKLACSYPQESRSPSSHEGSLPDGPTTPLQDVEDHELVTYRKEFSPSSPTWLVPSFDTAAGALTTMDVYFMNYYKQDVWQSMTYRASEIVPNSTDDGRAINRLNRDWAPQQSMSKDYLMYTLLTISASHSAIVGKNPAARSAAMHYRSRALKTYTRALSDVSEDNYESLLMTSLYMMTLVPAPKLPCDDATCLDYMLKVFNMMQGLRVLAGMRWAAGIEKLTVYPIFKREIYKLPPPPVLSTPPVYTSSGPDDDDPIHPNPAATYGHMATPPETPPPPQPKKSAGRDMSNLPFRPQELMRAGDQPHTPAEWRPQLQWQLPFPAFLPPPLMALLEYLVSPPSHVISATLHQPVMVPALHAFSPIFLSLYYYHLEADFYVRAFVLPTFLTKEFFGLVAAQEPRALIVVGWYFAFLRLIPSTWWMESMIARLLQMISNAVMRSNDKMLMRAIEGAYKLVRDVERKGREGAARAVFDGWEGVIWEEGPTKAETWRFEELVDLNAGGS